jgi:hypothetical protein
MFISFYNKCKNLIANSQLILIDLNDPYLARIVKVTELQLDSVFQKELKMS